VTTAYQRLVTYSASHRYPGTVAALARVVGLGYGATCKALRRQPLCGWVAAKLPPPKPVPLPPQPPTALPTPEPSPSPEVEFRRRVEQATPEERAALFAEARRRRWWDDE
jgi:hypothetical protein